MGGAGKWGPMRIGGRTRKERQERKGREAGVLKRWEEQEIVGVMQQCNVENGLKGGSQEKKGLEWEVGSLDHPFHQLLLTVHENMSVPWCRTKSSVSLS